MTSQIEYLALQTLHPILVPLLQGVDLFVSFSEFLGSRIKLRLGISELGLDTLESRLEVASVDTSRDSDRKDQSGCNWIHDRPLAFSKHPLLPNDFDDLTGGKCSQ